MFGSTGQKRYDLRNRTTPADYRDRTGGKAARDAEDEPAEKLQMCGARHVSVPRWYGDQGSERQRVMRSLLRKRFACPACRTARRRGGPAAVGKAARIIGSNFLRHAIIAQQMRNGLGETRHNCPLIALPTIQGATFCPCRHCTAQDPRAPQIQTPRHCRGVCNCCAA